ncbi:hypothetical protein O6P43_023745 [Quillaja saponaria]|uniref:Uncharacterized protein n=1 Tax=Quillaja saponaria TaxID=32244 RepID=A0AAD7LGK4_QUISA|nr:hypothetical protein O6P43_023745 [Quillaja saponaria]
MPVESLNSKKPSSLHCTKIQVLELTCWDLDFKRNHKDLKGRLSPFGCDPVNVASSHSGTTSYNEDSLTVKPAVESSSP